MQEALADEALSSPSSFRLHGQQRHLVNTAKESTTLKSDSTCSPRSDSCHSPMSLRQHQCASIDSTCTGASVVVDKVAWRTFVARLSNFYFQFSGNLHWWLQLGYDSCGFLSVWNDCWPDDDDNDDDGRISAEKVEGTPPLPPFHSSPLRRRPPKSS